MFFFCQYQSAWGRQILFAKYTHFYMYIYWTIEQPGTNMPQHAAVKGDIILKQLLKLLLPKRASSTGFYVPPYQNYGTLFHNSDDRTR